MVYRKKIHWGVYLIILVPILIFAYLFSGIFTFPDLSASNFADRLLLVVSHPLTPWWNDKTAACLCVGLLAWVMLCGYIIGYFRNYQPGIEYGSADWADVARVRKILASEKPEHNRVLSRNIQVATQGPRKLVNNNMLIIGSSGSGKTTSLLLSNILRGNANYIVLDVKGEVSKICGRYLEEKRGYAVKVLNLKDMLRSIRYNPFTYVEKETDLMSLIDVIADAVQEEGSGKEASIWHQGPKKLLQALFYYAWLRGRLAHRTPTLNDVMELLKYHSELVPVDSPEVRALIEDGLMPPPKDKKTVSRLEIRMRELEGEIPGNAATRHYLGIFSDSSPMETIESFRLIVDTWTRLFSVDEVKFLFSGDEVRLEEFAYGADGAKDSPTDKKSALFIVVDDFSHTFHFIAAMLYTQAFSTLFRLADESAERTLRIPLEFWMDEFYTGAKPKDPEGLLGVVRSRNMSMIPILQSKAQLDACLPKDRDKIMYANIPAMIFLKGAKDDVDTLKWMSELLGDATIDVRTDGRSGQSGSTNNQKIARRLMTPQEVAHMPNDHCIVIIDGQDPIYDFKSSYWLMDGVVPYTESRECGQYEYPETARRDPVTGEYFRRRTEKAPLEDVGGDRTPVGQVIDVESEEFLYYSFRSHTRVPESEIEGAAAMFNKLYPEVRSL